MPSGCQDLRRWTKAWETDPDAPEAQESKRVQNGRVENQDKLASVLRCGNLNCGIPSTFVHRTHTHAHTHTPNVFFLKTGVGLSDTAVEDLSNARPVPATPSMSSPKELPQGSPPLGDSSSGVKGIFCVTQILRT